MLEYLFVNRFLLEKNIVSLADSELQYCEDLLIMERNRVETKNTAALFMSVGRLKLQWRIEVIGAGF